jgi:hypothetical protein
VLFVAIPLPASVLLMGIVSLVGAAMYANGPDDIPAWGALLMVVCCGELTWLCVSVGGRLVSGRERPAGGLVPPWILYVGAFLMTMSAAGRACIYGAESAAGEYSAGAETLSQARSQRLKERSLAKTRARTRHHSLR